MGNKVVCLDCRKSFSQGTDYNNRRVANCPDCGKPMVFLSHRFRPPKKTETQKWEVVRFLVANGFDYDHVYEKMEIIRGCKVYSSYAKYPENLGEANEFVEKYRDQSNNY